MATVTTAVFIPLLQSPAAIVLIGALRGGVVETVGDGHLIEGLASEFIGFDEHSRTHVLVPGSFGPHLGQQAAVGGVGRGL